MNIDMKKASLLALIGIGIVILCSIAYPICGWLYSFLCRFVGIPYVIMEVVGFVIGVVKLVGLALMGTFFFVFWRSQK